MGQASWGLSLVPPGSHASFPTSPAPLSHTCLQRQGQDREVPVVFPALGPAPCPGAVFLAAQVCPGSIRILVEASGEGALEPVGPTAGVAVPRFLLHSLAWGSPCWTCGQEGSRCVPWCPPAVVPGVTQVAPRLCFPLQAPGPCSSVRAEEQPRGNIPVPSVRDDLPAFLGSVFTSSVPLEK